MTDTREGHAMEEHGKPELPALRYAPKKSCATETLVAVEESLPGCTEKDSTDLAMSNASGSQHGNIAVTS